MKAGFAKVNVNPRLPVSLEGLGVRTPADKIHDDLFLRCVYVTHEDRDALIIGCDLLFFERSAIDRLKGALGRVLALAPHQILFNVSHNHAGPRLTDWAYGANGADKDPFYIEQIEASLLDAAKRAKQSAVNVEVWAGVTKTDVPVSRRQPQPDGKVAWKPSHSAPICDALPVTVLKTPANEGAKVIAVLFSVSCHPSSWYEPEVSADYPGVAQRLINEYFKTDGATFLQGCGGDTKPKHVADGETRWRHGKWEDVEASGRDIANAVAELEKKGLTRYAPEVRCHYEETYWPMEKPPTADELRAVINAPEPHPVKVPWAKDMLRRLERFGALPTSVPVGVHGVQIARGVRFVALEGESVGELGNLMLAVYNRGVTFPLGYTNGTQLYLPVKRQHPEEGYEVVSFYEYHWPAPLKPVEDDIVTQTLKRFQTSGALPNDSKTG